MGVVGLVVAIDQEVILAPGEAELATLDAGERLEGRPRGPPAVLAVAVHGVAELVGHRIGNGAAEAFAGKRIRHGEQLR